MTHKSDDYKISAVKYYLKNKDQFIYQEARILHLV
jgi:hypothetical protein